MATNSKPGVMIYFNTVMPFLNQMTDEQAGIFFKAIMNYAQDGMVTELDSVSNIAFNLLRPIIDRDTEKYFETVEKRRYATYCREAEKHGEKPLSLLEWQQHHVVSHDNTWYLNIN